MPRSSPSTPNNSVSPCITPRRAKRALETFAQTREDLAAAALLPKRAATAKRVSIEVAATRLAYGELSDLARAKHDLDSAEMMAYASRGLPSRKALQRIRKPNRFEKDDKLPYAVDDWAAWEPRVPSDEVRTTLATIVSTIDAFISNHPATPESSIDLFEDIAMEFPDLDPIPARLTRFMAKAELNRLAAELEARGVETFAAYFYTRAGNQRSLRELVERHLRAGDLGRAQSIIRDAVDPPLDRVLARRFIEDQDGPDVDYGDALDHLLFATRFEIKRALRDAAEK